MSLAFYTKPIRTTPDATYRNVLTGQTMTFAAWCNAGVGAAVAHGKFPTAGRVWIEEYIRAGLLLPVRSRRARAATVVA
jgi:hypothetical protein